MAEVRQRKSTKKISVAIDDPSTFDQPDNSKMPKTNCCGLLMMTTSALLFTIGRSVLGCIISPFRFLFNLFNRIFRSGSPSHVLKRPRFADEGPQYKVIYPDDHQFWSADRTFEKIIQFAEKGIASKEECPPRTIPEVFQLAVTNSATTPILRCERPLPPWDEKTKTAPPSKPFEEWKTWTCQQYYDESFLVARAFISLGLQRFDGVNIFGFNAPEWLFAEIATIFAGGIVAGIYPSDSLDQVVYKSHHSHSSIAVCEHSKVAVFEQAVKEGHLPRLKAIIYWGSESSSDEPDTVEYKQQTVLKVAWNQLPKIAESTPQEVVQKIIGSQRPGHVVSYIYTSGTTGNPKAVMITHDNIIFESMCVASLLPQDILQREMRVVSFLPLSHVAGAMVDIVTPIGVAALYPGHCIVGFARPYDLKRFSLAARLQCIKPSIFLGVPRVWEKIAAKMQRIGRGLPAPLRKVSAFAKGKGLEHAMNCQLGGSGEKPALFGLADTLVLSNVKDKLGLSECRFGFTGAAPITTDTLSYFGKLGININEVYGMSECTGATTFSTDEAHLWGSCGFVMPGTEVKIFRVSPSDSKDMKECPLAKDIFNATEDEQGEICFRGRHIMTGYMANPSLGEDHVALIKRKNLEAIDSSGWLHSGDKGCIGVNGMVKITGRYKDIIIGAGGENIAPVPIENEIKRLCPLLSNVIMIGDGRKYNVAIVTLTNKGTGSAEFPGTDELDGDAATFKSTVTTVSDAMQDADFIQSITDAITATNQNGLVTISNAAKIQKFTILPRDFSQETGEVTPTLKTKRNIVQSKHASLIERMYLSNDTYVPAVPDKPSQ